MKKMKARVISTALAVAMGNNGACRMWRFQRSKRDGKGEKRKCRSCVGILSRILP